MRARVLTELVAVGPRRACSDAERRAARLLARELRAQGRRPRTETVWVRPQWPVLWLLHALLGIAASVVSVDAPAVGLGLAAFAALSALVELSGRARVLSLLLPRRATQNVIAESPDRGEVRVIVTAPYDAPRRHTAFVRPLARADEALRHGTRGWLPHPLAILTLALVALAACAGARLGGVEGTALGVAQLLPTIACILSVAVLADLLVAPAAKGANAHASAAVTALAVVEALDARPPRRVAVDIVFAGAGEGPALGMAAFVRSRRRTTRAEEVAVLHLAPCGVGRPVAWRRGGPLVPLAFHPQLTRLAAATGVTRSMSGAVAVRRARWPVLALGCVDERGRTPEGVETAALQGAIDAATALVTALDRELSGRTS